MWGSQFLTEETTESRVLQSHVGCACVGVCVLLPAQVQRPALTKTGLARSGGLRKEENHENLSLFSPQALAKIQRHSLPSFADVVETMGDLTLGQLRSPSAYSLRVQAALRNAFVLCF